ncbi:MAG: DUF1571 domain-containing protein [Deltaproteobacteria bacterium]|nr:DUF1571 domain-containing protein [Deltaproteobacteria bacterium]
MMLARLLMLIPVLAAGPAVPSVDQILATADRTLAQTQDYRGKLLRQERFLDGMKSQLNDFKFKKPFSVYLRFIEPFPGREVIFVRGWNGDQLRVHRGSFPDITVSLDPRGSKALARCHHPVTDFGLENTIRLAGKNLRLAMKRGEGEIRVKDGGLVNGQPVWTIEARFPRGGTFVTARDGETLWDISRRTGQDMYLLLYTNQDKDYDEPDDVDEGDRVFVPRYYGAAAEFHVDKQLCLPVRVVIRDWQGRLYEQYDYTEIERNAGLTRKDFDPDNPAYKF